jgi:hypothetical protein
MQKNIMEIGKIYFTNRDEELPRPIKEITKKLSNEIKQDEKTLAKTHGSYIRKMIDVNQKNNLMGFFDESSL